MGFPIRTSADRGLVDGSPQLFAVTHVLHRFLAPRHPPLALCSLEILIYDRSFELKMSVPEGTNKMLVLALQFSRCDVTHAEPARARRSGVGRCCVQLLQNGREDGNRRRRLSGGGTESLRPSRSVADSPPVHQLGVSRPGRSGDDLQTRKHSLERR